MSNDQIPMEPVSAAMDGVRDGPALRYDIYARLFQFSVRIIRFTRTFPRTVDGIEMAKQLIRAGTSVGANMEEADGAESRKDFAHKARISRKESRESRYWLRLCQATEVGDPKECRELIQESDSLVRILSAIITHTVANTPPRSSTR